MHFLRPEFLWLFLLLPLVYGLQYSRQRSLGSWNQLIAKQLQPYMLNKAKHKDPLNKWQSPLLMGLLTLCIVALSGPSWNKHASDVYDSQSGLVIALDLSLSMTAQDVAPSRLQRAKFKIIDVLDQYSDKNMALMAYSGDAHVATPLTKDNKTIKAMLSALDPYIMPEPGSNLVRLVDQAIELFEQGQTQGRQLLLVTDGVEQQDITAAAERLKQADIQLGILAVGTEEGAPIVRPSGQFFKDSQGQVIMPALEWQNLQALAQQSNASLARLQSDDSDIQSLISTASSDDIRKADDSLVFDQWADNGVWFLWLALPFTLLFFRKGLLLSALFITITLPTGETWAAPFEDTPDWMLNSDQQARKQFTTNPERAADLFTNEKWQASSHYKSGNYEKALEHWQQFNDANSLYNQGNALAKMNRFDDAIDAYSAALEKDPQHNKAQFNKDLVEKIKQQQDNQQQNSQDQQQDGQQQDGQQKSDQDSQSSEQQDSKSQQDGESQESNDQTSFDEQSASENPNQSEKDSEADAASQANNETPPEQDSEQKQASKLESQEAMDPVEQQSSVEQRQQSEQDQAMQQWMERIPDDPGGLLRNKFLYQYKNRDRDESNGDRKPW